MEIMKLIPTGKDYLWGGTRLREEYGKKIDLTPLAETWECSVHPDGPSYVANGTYKGKTLAEVLKAHPEYLGTKVEDSELPVLVKFIDAKKDLSVQVHPSDEYAREHEGDNGKTEMWYVIDADEGANLIYGFQHEVTEKILRKAVETGTLDKHLQKVPVHKGDTYFVPAGTVHGIGKGILLAEIQESSNVTYRVYDYNRVDKNGKKLGYVSDEEAKTMMRDCKAFLFPTFYEGFGIPPLEAMSVGAKNIYVSDTAVMHEIFGDSVHYINPYKYNDIFDDDAADSEECIRKVLLKYSWKKSAILLRKIVELDRW